MQAAANLCYDGGGPPPLLLVDTVVGLPHLLASSVPITLLKLNASELRSVTSAWLPPTTTQDRPLQDCALAVLDRHASVHAVAVTAGPAEAHLWRRWSGAEASAHAVPPEPTEHGPYVLHVAYAIPPLGPEALVNPIGAGDTCAGVLLTWLVSAAALHGGAPSSVEKALLWGLAAATASCRRVETAEFDMHATSEAAENIRVTSHLCCLSDHR